MLKAGLKDETDYTNLEGLYNILKLPEQSKFIGELKKEKYPDGKWTINEKVQKFYSETNPDKKKELLDEIEKNVATNKDWATYERTLPSFRSGFVNAYGNKKQWDNFKAEASKLPKITMASLFNSHAWKLQEKNEDLNIAEELSRMATEVAKSEWKKPTSERPMYATAKQWEKQCESNFVMFSDTYAMVLYRQSQYQKGYEVIKEAAITISKGVDADLNNTYSLLAEKALPTASALKEIEGFVKAGNATSETKEVLKRLYILDKKTEDGFSAYLENLERESYLKMIDEIKNAMLNEATEQFSIVDINGNKVNSADWKGKVVVVDFWATWCGPCIASFPAMQKAVTKYQENPSVKFVFINTWENGDKQKKASEFIATNRYTFDVLMDTDNAIVEQFKVNGIPTKFILDKEGKIRFKSMGYSGDDDKLLAELSTMIDMANQ
jgi:thiol-disulfide isomerase/thioredoxin